jgi:hypothetical protein
MRSSIPRWQGFYTRSRTSETEGTPQEEWGFLSAGQYLIHDRDGKYCPAFHQIIDAAGVKRVPLPARSPNLNAYAERWVRSVKEECLWRLILFGEASLRHALTQYGEHFHHERNHQGKGNVLLFPTVSPDAERACSGREGLNRAGESPVVPIARFRHVAIPQFVAGNHTFMAWRKRPGCPEDFEPLR